MTDQERNQILKMIEDGRITPEQGLSLMQVLDQSPAEAPQPAPAAAAPNPEAAAQARSSGFETDPRIGKIKSTVRRFWQIPLWIGIGITILSALGMYAIMRGPGKVPGTGMNFWFYFLLLPLLLGVAVIALAVGSHKAHWIFVEVQQKPGEHPERIFLGFPLPLKFAAWFLRTFGPLIPGLRDSNLKMAELSQFIQTGFTSHEPLIVNVDEGEGSERVRVYIG
jgi:hypothetical protein